MLIGNLKAFLSAPGSSTRGINTGVRDQRNPLLGCTAPVPWVPAGVEKARKFARVWSRKQNGAGERGVHLVRSEKIDRYGVCRIRSGNLGHEPTSAGDGLKAR